MSCREVYAMAGSSTLADRKYRIYSELKYQYIDIPKLLYNTSFALDKSESG